MPLPWEEDFKPVAEGVVRITWISYKGFTRDVFAKAMQSSKDWSRWVSAESKESFLKEVEFYKEPLHKLQGLYIPFSVYGGVFHNQVIIATTSSGATASLELLTTHHNWGPCLIRESLARVHQAGVLHGDIAWRNVALNLESKTAHLLDFGRATQHKEPTEFEKFQAKDKEALEDLLSCVSARKRVRGSF
mmetsp:Transcript_5254/g.10876  ORF Transcript_5254/g.10876 Transcript_5254/m.10876 type:complete len:190 (-) Transcript_5254:233-802(-)|eukprot:CAMPEP_0171520502 /NCGR_PEP_ID=MMETSP0959-20130129/6553_1 /TAXON_ID=87120 /ORGANISM="Aurantiochytrium limacinum, Strain ATCCMYA-1381" /LENGTH=189 /DNA_ID=CAMNT_0012060181 /DNA_START=684 /DNA_END=1253 /DNA_ORIENTATION=-